MNENVEEVVGKVHALFRERGLRLSIAESCTGGLIAHYITEREGASFFFEAGLVPYSAGSKRTILKISSSILSTQGVVSEETAREMAEKVRTATGTDYGLSTTGNLGPETLEERPVGLVYIAVSSEGMTFSRGMKFSGDRTTIKESAAISALRILVEAAEMMG